MTTGRINQVTTFHPHTPQRCDAQYSQLFKAAFSSQEFVHQWSMATNLTATAKECSSSLANGPTGQLPSTLTSQTHLVPRNLTSFRHISPCQMTRIKAFRGNCLQLAYTQSWRIPKWLNKIESFALISKQSTIPSPHLQATMKKLLKLDQLNQQC